MKRIIFIRHAEKPHDGFAGVNEQGNQDDESLVPVGWQRAGALIRLFNPHNAVEADSILPSVIFAAGIGEGSRSKRSLETATPLARVLAPQGVPFVTRYLKGDHSGLAADVAGRSGIVLIVWEHNQIPTIAAIVAPGTDAPMIWPDRFDLVWIFDQSADGWTFSQRRQMLLAGDEQNSTP